MDERTTVRPADRAEWRAWLAEHHRDSGGVWMITPRRATGRSTVSYDEAVEEALCFGWIDSQTSRVDDEYAAQWFAPRRPRSTWARSNKERVERLIAAGLMTEAGLEAIERARANGSWSSLDDVEALVMPDDLAAALDIVPDGRRKFDESSTSARKMALGWVGQAKRPATRANRIGAIAETLSAGRSLVSVFPRRD
jgi:uncharacterized protein YdeI (YjbR/CyaY-like superfamily)